MKKIMFNDRYGLTEAVLNGRKTMTRRAVKCPKKAYDFKVCKYANGKCSISLCDAEGFPIGELRPKYKVGEVVAIAQAYQNVRPFHFEEWQIDQDWFEKGWNNKMFVKAKLMPHHIKITAIRVERLQNIQEMECLREGIRPCNFGKKFTPGDKRAYNTAREAFAALIDKVGKKGTWASNPWVFAYSFELVD